jgi:Integrase core domain
VLTDNAIAISMDGKGAWRGNVFVERLWRSVKYEEVNLRAYDNVSEARASIGRYLDFYNARRPHSSLDGMTPDQAYFPRLPLRCGHKRQHNGAVCGHHPSPRANAIRGAGIDQRSPRGARR